MAGLHRLSTTHVKYDIRDAEFRRRGTVSLVEAEVKESLKDGTASVAFSIPSHVRRLMTSARSYTWVELAAFPKFRSRYTARLYQRLALLAGYDDAVRKPWEISPQDLAKLLGWKHSGPFRYADFRRFCLDPMRWDLEANVMRFSVLTKEVHAEAKGRGRRAVALLRFTVTPEMKKLETLVAEPLNAVEIAEVTKPDSSLTADKLPSLGAVGRVVRLLEGRQAAVFLSEAWRAAVDEAIEGTLRTDARAPGEHDLHGRDLLDLIERMGANHSFYVWAQRADHTGRFLTRREREPEAVQGYKPSIRDLPAEERPRAYAMKEAQEVLDQLAGKPRPIGRSSFPMWRQSWCDHEGGPWNWVVEDRHPEGTALMKKALRLIWRMSEEESRRTIYNLAQAVLADDMDKIDAICRAVCATARVDAVAAVDPN